MEATNCFQSARDLQMQASNEDDCIGQQHAFSKCGSAAMTHALPQGYWLQAGSSGVEPVDVESREMISHTSV